MKGLSSNRIALKVGVIGPERNTACRRVRASFSPEMLQARAVKGLIRSINKRAVSVLLRYVYVVCVCCYSSECHTAFSYQEEAIGSLT